jgi:EEF1A lysine methyltransferase 4
MKMYEDGFHNITNVDYSDVVINKMRNRWKHLPEMEWMVADALDMTSLPCSSFDVVLEKGTIDAMLVSEKDPWHISAVAENTIDLVMKQVGH